VPQGRTQQLRRPDGWREQKDCRRAFWKNSYPFTFDVYALTYLLWRLIVLILKRAAILTCLLLMLLASSSLAWTNSFRSAATGDLLYGDFDNDMDPIYIWDNQGYRIYSTLSNLSTTFDEFVDGNTDDVYLFGTSGNFGLPQLGDWTSRTMFLISLADSRTDYAHGLDTDFDGAEDEDGEGYMSGDRTQLFDFNDDNIYDTRVNYQSTADYFRLIKNRDWSLVHSYGRDKTKFGISFSHFAFGPNSYVERNDRITPFEIISPTHLYSYTNRMVQTDLSTQETIEDRRESADFSSTTETPTNVVRLSFQTPFMGDNAALRFDLSYASITDEYTEDNSFSYFRDVSTGGVTDIISQRETLTRERMESGHVITPTVRVTRYWDTNVYSWFDLAYGFGSSDANDAYFDRYTANFQQPFLGNTDVYTDRVDTRTDQTGETKHKSFALYHKTVVDFTEKFTFAAGLGFQYMKDETDWAATESVNRLETYDNGDALTDANDYTSTATQSRDRTYLETEKTTVVSLPVAMEYTLGRWTFRLGAEHNIWREVNETDDLIVKSEPEVVTTEFGDGTTVTTTWDDDFVSLGQATEDRYSVTNFVYGLQFVANDNLKIELLQFLSNDEHFVDSEFYQQLRLSLTVLF